MYGRVAIKREPISHVMLNLVIPNLVMPSAALLRETKQCEVEASLAHAKRQVIVPAMGTPLPNFVWNRLKRECLEKRRDASTP